MSVGSQQRDPCHALVPGWEGDTVTSSGAGVGEGACLQSCVGAAVWSLEPARKAASLVFINDPSGSCRVPQRHSGFNKPQLQRGFRAGSCEGWMDGQTDSMEPAGVQIPLPGRKEPRNLPSPPPSSSSGRQGGKAPQGLPGLRKTCQKASGRGNLFFAGRKGTNISVP